MLRRSNSSNPVHRAARRLAHAFMGLVLLCPAMVVATDRATPAPTQDGFISGTFEGRGYGIYIPPSVITPAPAVFVLHGGGGNGEIIRSYSGFDAQARSHRVVAVYPNGAATFWNDGRESQEVVKSSADDVQYLSGLIDGLAARHLIDPSQVYLIGISNGGGMALRMACEASERIAGIGVITTKQLQNVDCSRVTPTPAAFFFGTEDKVSPHDGRVKGDEGLWGNKGKTYSAEATLALWKTFNRCTGGARSVTLDADPDDDTVVYRHIYEGCAAPLAYYEIAGGGHSWPGSPAKIRNPLTNYVLGTVSYEINANEEALKLWFRR